MTIRAWNGWARGPRPFGKDESMVRFAVVVFILCVFAAAIFLSRNSPLRIVKELGSDHEAHGDVPWIVTQAQYPSPKKLRDVEPMGM